MSKRIIGVIFYLALLLSACQAKTVRSTPSAATVTANPTLPPTAIPVVEVPFKNEDVKFRSGNIPLSGTLSLPEISGPHPAVIFISGSGRQTRDGDPWMNGFRILAEDLARQGIAVLRYDDRGAGRSGGGSSTDTMETFAEDAYAAVQYLKARPDIDPHRIGLLGHSEGGLIAPMVAVRTTDVAFIVMLAGPVLPGTDTLLDQMRIRIRDNAHSEAEYNTHVALWEELLQMAASGQELDAVRPMMEKVYRETIQGLPESERPPAGEIEKVVQEIVEGDIRFLDNPEMRFFLAHDPASTLQEVNIPVLALYGELDKQVFPESHSAAARKVLETGASPDFTILVIPQANHLFQSAITGKVDEYTSLKKEFVPGFLDIISGWILTHTQKG